jgi:two-component system CheB/CheR fusion protein
MEELIPDTSNIKVKNQKSGHPKGVHVSNPFTVVAIGASAGGLEAITLILKNLSPTTGMAFIYVQHLSPDHKSLLTPLLSKVTQMKVQEIEDMDKMEPNNVYVIPHDRDIEVTNGHIKLIPRPKNKTSNLSIDVLFTSLADTHKENVIGIVLSGNAHDGTRGLKEIKQAGGITFAQNDSAKFNSMPHSAIAEGVVDFVLSPEEISNELNTISEHSLMKQTAKKEVPEDEIDNSDPHLTTIIELLHANKNVDFSNYKMNTIKRRILRRMLIYKMRTIEQYAQLLVQNSQEAELLYQDLLINVTEFFRDNEAFLLLQNTIFPKLISNKLPGEKLRIWVSACATGEEVYSIAMVIAELLTNETNQVTFQIFASDLSIEAINEARIAEYTIKQLANVSPERIQKFFIKTKDKYRISKNLRDVCIFAQHNLLNDPSFSRMDFISCRNLLIYLDVYAQQKAIATFHYALNDGGCLMLGKSETIGNSVQLFAPIDKKYKIYSRKKNASTQRVADTTPRIMQTNLMDKANITTALPKKMQVSNNGNLSTVFDSVLLAQYVPASVVINYDLDILQFRGNTHLYLQHASGRASLNILKMAHIEITFELRNVIHNAIKTKQTVRKTGIEMNGNKTENEIRIVSVEVAPLNTDGEEPLLIIVFSEYKQIETHHEAGKNGENNTIAKDRRIKKLEEELAAARTDMASITQDQEAANEELQTANEEIISNNEELQSLNEELETSKEEIESTNEELITSNQELNARIQQVEELYTYYEAILSTIHEPMLVLDKNIRIKSANKSFCKNFQVTEEDCIGRSLYKLGNNQWNIPRLRELLEDIVPKNNTFHDFEVEHSFPAIGQKTMLLNAHRVEMQSQNEELIVLTIADITDVKRLAIELEVKEKNALEGQLANKKKAMLLIEASEKRYNMMLMQSPFAIAILKGKDMVIALANDSIKEMWGKGNDLEGKKFLDIMPELKDSEFPKQLENVYETGIAFQGHELLASLKRNGKMIDGYFNFVYQPYFEADKTISGVTVIAYEVTEQVLAKNELIEAKRVAEHNTEIAEEAAKSKQQFLANMSHEIRTPMNAIIGFTHVVLKTMLDEKQKEYINAIKVSGDSLVIIIDDILDLAKVNAGKMTFEQKPFDMSHAISSILQLFEPKIMEKNLALIKEYDSTIPAFLLGDPMRLRQIILNLISNAFKFTAEGTITIKVQMLKENTNSVVIRFDLVDTGIGIPENRLEHIFNDYEQASRETTSSYGGTGLGLAIVKQLVELQGGTIEVKSQVGLGSVFSFTLGFGKTEDIVQEKVIIEKESLIQDVKVLVVEDTSMNQLLIKIILADFGFELDLADNGKIAIEMLQQNKYDIVLMDLQMPEMNGFDAAKYIREVLKSNIPIIALTADVTAADVEKCKEMGMNDYISKPINEKTLYKKMIQFLKKQ